MVNKICGVYEILNTSNNKRYIGSSVDIYHRLHHHKDRLKQNKHSNNYLQKSWNKYGEIVFQFNTILICSQKDLEFYEQLIIDGYKSNQRSFGYNLRKVTKSNAGMILPRTMKVGNKYNRLTLIRPTDRTRKDGTHYWLAECECGTVKEIHGTDIRTGHTKSCGCLNRERLIERITVWNKNNEPWNKKKGSSDYNLYQ